MKVSVKPRACSHASSAVAAVSSLLEWLKNRTAINPLRRRAYLHELVVVSHRRMASYDNNMEGTAPLEPIRVGEILRVRCRRGSAEQTISHGAHCSFSPRARRRSG